MLSYLSVRHLAVVDDIELHFSDGMTSLTGETGAGKSILVDAMSLVLGDRADSKMVRYGKDRAEIEASFDTEKNKVLQQWLIEQELDDDEQCHLRRTISNEGRSRAYINGRTVPLSQLREVSKRTIDIHGQHAHQSLVRMETQRQLLDTVANTQTLLDELATQHQQWRTIQKQLDEHKQQSTDQAARVDLLQYQVNELEPLDLTVENIQQLVAEQQQLAHSSQLINSVDSSLHQLFEQDQGAAYDVIVAVLSDLEKAQDIEPKFVNIIETLNSAVIQLDECGNDLRHYRDNANTDPLHLEQLEEKLSVLHNFARKHQIETEALPAHYQQLCDELAAIEQHDNDHEELYGACQGNDR